MNRFVQRVGLTIAILMMGALLFVLPLDKGEPFLSPDETAVAITAYQLSETRSFRLSWDYLRLYPWAHPRSFVTQGDAMVPVGFLGWPVMIAIVIRLIGYWSIGFLTPLLVLSMMYPLWSFTKSWGKWASVAAVFGWLTFPTVILYANRGLFPNLPVLCLAIWSGWLVLHARRGWYLIMAGVLLGLSLSFRPTEAIWILPWIVGCWIKTDVMANSMKRSNASGAMASIRPYAAFVIPFLIITLFHAWLGWKTYGSWFVSGYQLRDTVVTISAAETVGGLHEGGQESLAPTGLFATWPFGFHPRNVWFNVRSYLLTYLFPWTLVVFFAAVLAWRDKKNRIWILLGAWTIASLCLMYGQGLYQDHVQINHISLANSFLRYLLPISFLFAISFGWLVRSILFMCHSRAGGNLILPIEQDSRFHGNDTGGRMRLLKMSWCKFLVTILILGISAGGLWTAFLRDDEGIMQNRKELVKYDKIMMQTVHLLNEFPGEPVIFSERSDKIFVFIAPVVSPLPTLKLMNSMFQNDELTKLFFLRTQTSQQLEDWKKEGIGIEPLFTVENETLYHATAL